jgi:PIN domain nuclease of toxin-antitoxin system
MIFLDTHVMVWLYAGLLQNIPKKIQHQLESMDLYISPMVELELDYLHEIGRTTVPGVDIVRYLDAHMGVMVSRVDFYRIVEEAQQQRWTRDPFDRLIVANASVFQAPLITKDERILQNYSLAIW